MHGYRTSTEYTGSLGYNNSVYRKIRTHLDLLSLLHLFLCPSICYSQKYIANMSISVDTVILFRSFVYCTALVCSVFRGRDDGFLFAVTILGLKSFRQNIFRREASAIVFK